MNFESSLDFCFLSGIKLVSYYNAADKKGLDLHGQSFSFKWNMHHKYDVNSKDIFYIIDLDFFWKFCVISKWAHFVPSFYLLILLTFHSNQAQFTLPDNLRLMRRKSEECWDNMYLSTYDAKFSTTKIQQPNLWYKINLLISLYHIYGAYSL